MKIRTKLTIRYLIATALLVVAVFVVLEALLFPQAGYDMFRILSIRLLAIWVVSFAILFVIGYFMARSVLKPVSKIVKQVEDITDSNLGKRVEIDNPKDEIGELAATFNDMLDRLEKSFEAQKMFVSNVSHELRTPMAALIAELELSLHKERSNEDYKKVVENALADARNIEKLSNGLMDLAKASYHTDQIKMTSVRLDEALLDASAMVMKARGDYNVDLIFGDYTDDDRMATIHGNEYLLRTAFVNLMENNCKFSHNHSSTVQISFLGSKVFLRFSDTGIGISREDMEQMFKPFYRGKNRYFSAGNGIGMTLVERIVKLHGGTISVNSLQGEGTVFTLAFEHV
jgi:signal transduction histidine kinase